MPEKNKAVFLDRDGVLIEDVHYLSRLNQVSLYADVPRNLLRLKKSGYKLIVVTNQSGIARGYFPETFVRKTHAFLNQILEPHNVVLDDFYYCPHHKDGYSPYNITCNCRKPEPDLVYQAAQKHAIDLIQSFMVGDKSSDIGLADNAGLKGILVKTGQGLEAVESVAENFPGTFICESFEQAVDYILKK